MTDMLQWLLGLFKSSRPAATVKRAAVVVSSEPAAQTPPPFLRHQAILDRNQQVAAYVFTMETLAAMRDRARQEASQKFSDSAPIDQFVTDTLAGLLGKRLAFLPLSPASLESVKLDLLPRQNLVIDFDPPPGVEFDRKAVLARLTALHESGFQLSCGYNLEQDGLPEALALAQFISLGDVANLDPPDLLTLCRHLGGRYPESRLVARNIDSSELYQACRQMGIHLFQGRFLTQRTPKPSNKIAPYRILVLELLNAVRRQADYGELADLAWRDPALAYRLLRFVNSAAFGLREKIDHLKDAMAYLGQSELYRWLTLLLFNSNAPDQLDEALRETALVRARLAEKLAGGRMSRNECDEAFMVGILSVIDSLLEVPMEDALAQLSLPNAVSDALLRRQGKYAPYLKLVIASEEGEQESIRALAAECGIDAVTVNQHYLEALVWALVLSESLEG